MDTVLKKSFRARSSFIFFFAIFCVWLVIGLVVGFLKYNEHRELATDINNSIGIVNDVVAVLASDNSDKISGDFDEIYKTLYRCTSYEDIYITVRNMDCKTLTSNDITNEHNAYGIDEDSIYCKRMLAGEVPAFGKRNLLGQERAFRVSQYPELGLMVSTEVVMPNDYSSKISTTTRLFIISVVILGAIITLFFVLYMLRFNNSIERLYLMLQRIYHNEDPSELLKNFHWNRNVDSLANVIVTIYADKIKIIEEHYAEKEKSFEEEQHDMHAKRILTNNMRHELKTPIGIISGYIETILEHPDLPQDLQKKFLNSCMKNVRRINNLVTSLSLLSRLEDGADTIIYEDTNLTETINEIVEEFIPKLKEVGMKFVFQIPDELHVLSSNTSLYAMFNNLIKNAMNYSHGTEMGLTLLGEDEHFYKFSFWDNGEGVEQEYLEHLFEHFFRVEKNATHATDGTGLGLPIVKLVIDNHGGQITVQNRANGGLEYIFTLPKVEDKSSHKENNDGSDDDNII